MLYDFLKKRTDQGAVNDFFVLGALGLALNYLNQWFTWNFESLYHAIFCYAIFTLSYLLLFVFVYRWWVRKFKSKVKLFSKGKSKKNKRKAAKPIYFKEPWTFKEWFFPGLVSLFLLMIYVASALNFSNLYHFKKMILESQNIRATYSFKGNAATKTPDARYLVVNNMISDYMDDGTLAFANDFSNAFQEEINSANLPIQLLENQEETALDSLKAVYEEIYVLKGTYQDNEAQIYVERNYYNDFSTIMELYGQNISPQLDSMIQRLASSPRRLQRKLFYDQDNELIDEYNIELGIPSEMKYFIYSTIGDLISREVTRRQAKLTNQDSLFIKSAITDLHHTADYGIALLALAQSNVPYEINYLGFRPQKRRDINPKKIDASLGTLHLMKAGLFLKQMNWETAALQATLMHKCEQQLEWCEKYLTKVPKMAYRSAMPSLAEGMKNNLTHYMLVQRVMSLKIKRVKAKVERLKGDMLPDKKRSGAANESFPKLLKRKPSKADALRWLGDLKTIKTEIAVVLDLEEELIEGFEELNDELVVNGQLIPTKIRKMIPLIQSGNKQNIAKLRMVQADLDHKIKTLEKIQRRLQ
ncbi:MAG: hypothetical protein AAGG75_19155 [Bacteroidota bacterium]